MLTCTFEDGASTKNLRHVTVSALVIRNNSEILLVKRAPGLTCPGKYALPGGYMNSDERVVDAARREVFEETGYETKDPILFLIDDVERRKNEDRQNLDFGIILTALAKTGEPDQESSEIKWFSLDNLPHEGNWAFDHFEIVQRYSEYLKNPCPLPITQFVY